MSDAASSSDAPLPPSLATLTDLTTFKLTRKLRVDNEAAHLLGTFTPHPAPAILTIRATKLSTELVDNLITTLNTTATSTTTTTTTPAPQLTLRHANDIYYSFILTATLPNHIDIIYPCTDKHIAFLSSTLIDTLVTETPTLYTTTHLPHISTQLASPTAPGLAVQRTRRHQRAGSHHRTHRRLRCSRTARMGHALTRHTPRPTHTTLTWRNLTPSAACRASTAAGVHARRSGTSAERAVWGGWWGG